MQLTRDLPGLDGLLARSAQHSVFGSRGRSVIHAANARLARNPGLTPNPAGSAGA